MKKYTVLLIASILIISGCVSSQTATKNQTSEPPVKEFKMKVDHAGYTFYSNNMFILTPTVNLGDKVKLLATTLVAEIEHSHGISLDEFNVNEVVLTANENEPKIIELTANKTGKFRIYCGPCSKGSFGNDHPELEAFLLVK